MSISRGLRLFALSTVWSTLAAAEIPETVFARPGVSGRVWVRQDVALEALREARLGLFKAEAPARIERLSRASTRSSGCHNFLYENENYPAETATFSRVLAGARDLRIYEVLDRSGGFLEDGRPVLMLELREVSRKAESELRLMVFEAAEFESGEGRIGRAEHKWPSPLVVGCRILDLWLAERAREQVDFHEISPEGRVVVDRQDGEINSAVDTGLDLLAFEYEAEVVRICGVLAKK